MLAALCLSNFQSDLEALQLQPMLPGVVDLLVLFPAVCKLFHMFLSQLEVAMATPRIVVTSIVDTKLPAKVMDNHTLLMARFLNNSQLFPCITVALQPLVAMEV